MRLGHEKMHMAWIMQAMCPGHANSSTHMRLGPLACTTCMQKCGAQPSFPAFVLGKARTFSPNPGRNSHYKY